jgi:hypothetical protein
VFKRGNITVWSHSMGTAWKVLVAAVMVASALGGCAPEIAEPLEAAKGAIDPRRLGVPADGALIGLLVYDITERYTEYTGPVRSARAAACFADKDTLRDVSMVSVNSQTLDVAGLGTYRLEKAAIPGNSAPSLRWMVIGLGGASFSRTYEMGRPIDLVQFTFLDTMSVAKGTTLRYNGAYNSGDMTVSITPNQTLTARYVHPDSSTTASMTLFKVRDDGTLSFTPERLATLIPNRVYDLKLEHGSYQTSTFQSGVVGHSTTATTIVSFLLKP